MPGFAFRPVCVGAAQLALMGCAGWLGRAAPPCATGNASHCTAAIASACDSVTSFNINDFIGDKDLIKDLEK